MPAVFGEQIFGIDKGKSRSNMRILQGFLPMDIQIFAVKNLIGSSPVRLASSIVPVSMHNSADALKVSRQTLVK